MFSFQVGQMPTLIGAELPFTYENANIERGLLWNQEPLISRGVQFNYSQGPISASLSVNDGYYSNEFTTVSGLITYTFKNSDILEVAGAGNTDTNFKTARRHHRRNHIVRHAAGPAAGPDLQRHLHPHPGALDDHALLPVQHGRRRRRSSSPARPARCGAAP